MHADGRTLAFVRDGKLWVGALKSDGPKEFRTAPFPNSDVGRVRFSPDGSKLLALRRSDGWILSYPSGAPSKLTSSSNPFDMNWFPDSRHLLAADLSRNGSTWWRWDTVDGSRAALYRSNEPMIGATVSPDGERIAYQTGQVEWNVLEISLPAATVRTLLSGSGVVSWWPDWAHLGTRYLVNTDRSGTFAIEEISASDGFSRRLIVPEQKQQAFTARLSPDGSRLTFLSGTEGSPPQLMLANASGGNRTRLDATPGATPAGVGGASWSPDSQWIVYARDVGSGKGQLVKLRPGSSSAPIVLAELTQSEGADWLNYPAVTWSPADDWIVYPRREGLFVISPDGKIDRKLTGRKLQTYGFSRDGKRLFGIYRDTTGKGAQWQLYSVDVKTGADTLLGPLDLPASTDSVAGFSMHPDGTRFLTSIAKWPFDIWMMEGFDQPQKGLARWLSWR